MNWKTFILALLALALLLAACFLWLRLRSARKDASVGENPAPEPSTQDISRDQELYKQLCEVIVGEQLYLAPDFERQVLVDRFRVSKNRIGNAFAAGGTSFPAFVTDCRLEHACRLLRDNPQMSIDEVAAASGFSLRTSFSRSFKQKYGLSPSEYRLPYEK